MSARREPIEYEQASGEVRAVYDDIMATRKTDWVNNFWHGAAARAKGMSEAQYSELLAIVGLANETNRLVTALGVPVDERFQ